nr:PREDICTED: tetra-peptide repeat homeobox protein 1-like [Apteryx mantelli mantelli]
MPQLWDITGEQEPQHHVSRIPVPGVSRIPVPGVSRIPGPRCEQDPWSLVIPVPDVSRIPVPGVSRVPVPGVSRIPDPQCEQHPWSPMQAGPVPGAKPPAGPGFLGGTTQPPWEGEGSRRAQELGTVQSPRKRSSSSSNGTRPVWLSKEYPSSQDGLGPGHSVVNPGDAQRHRGTLAEWSRMNPGEAECPGRRQTLHQ